jgi:phage shock protein PspC (stress-responsive transcriptional regulator)
MLYRHPTDKVIGGVCGGVAEFLGWNPVLVRVLWAGGTLFSWGGGMLVYLLLALFLPVGTHRSGQRASAGPHLEPARGDLDSWPADGGGALWLLANLGILPGLWGVLWALVAVVFWPAVLDRSGLSAFACQQPARPGFGESPAWRGRCATPGRLAAPAARPCLCGAAEPTACSPASAAASANRWGLTPTCCACCGSR